MDSGGIPESEAGEFGGFGDPLLSRLMTGDWNAVDEMAEDINKALDTVQEVEGEMQALKEKTLLGRTDEELKRDKDALFKARWTMKTLEKWAQKRDNLRAAGITLQLLKTLSMMCAQQRKEFQKISNEPDGKIEGSEEE